MHVPHLIERKRDGGVLSSGDIAALVHGYVSGAVPDYQMSALAMAIYFKGLNEAETAALTAAMRDSGSVFRWPESRPPVVDKHSTGGIGDTVSLILAPLLAADGLWVPMVSGRGLGITGGTLDKLESIPGFRTDLDEDRCLRQIEQIGVFMAGQTDRFCPADKMLYALRDVTATVPSRELIIASIMSKKLAESLDRLVLDVKFGSGAFMPDRESALALATGLAETGRANGVQTTYVLSPMNEPLGHSVGNALEVLEAIEVLQGRGAPDLVDTTLTLASHVSGSSHEALGRRLQDGTALQKFIELVEAQGGNAAFMDDHSHFHPSPVRMELRSWADGTISRMDAGTIGRACVCLGAGRKTTADAIDPSVGVSHLRKCGESVSRNEPLLCIHAASTEEARIAMESIRGGITISPS